MIIVAGGDSFVYGSELSDCDTFKGARGKNFKYSLKTFTALVSADYDYECVAWPGYGNDSIARRVIAECESIFPERPVVIVSWTFPGRYEFRFNYSTNQINSPWHTITPWTVNTIDAIKKEYATFDEKTLTDQIAALDRAQKTGVADFADTFYRHVGNNEYWEIYSSLKEIVYLQNYLKTNNIPYLFTCADNSIWYNNTIDRADNIIHSLTEQIRRDQENWFWFPAGINPQDTQSPRGFYQWAIENKYPVGTTHPLDEAHQAAAKLIQGKFNELVKKSV